MNTNFLLIVPYWYGSFCIINNLFKKNPSDWRFFFIKSSEIFRISMYVCVMTNRWCVCLILLWRGQKNWKECHRPLNQYTTYRLYSVKDVLKWKTTSQLFKTLTKYSWHVHNYCYMLSLQVLFLYLKIQIWYCNKLLMFQLCPFFSSQGNDVLWYWCILLVRENGQRWYGGCWSTIQGCCQGILC